MRETGPPRAEGTPGKGPVSSSEPPRRHRRSRTIAVAEASALTRTFEVVTGLVNQFPELWSRVLLSLILLFFPAGVMSADACWDILNALGYK